ncbi:MAG: CRISPR system precrRNA processing endoribonuclease RAMP protein Cas6 [Candidatus Nezhaarchaeota archaeon]|nr:CRISPR system precrRNA processing endoribonuclease RAMP protein Cas6 [Candidatus Nezhaarchaeota archaeon]MCX8142565.1 CRISPR system precrRNA processing endoribonuclease RAMP protein Cas6 [Candidatus Nezhaarchaeota archaeon]
MYLEGPVRIKVTISFKRDFFVKDYTAKLVKSLLMASNPRLEEVFSPKSFPPKPIHITPLYALGAGGGIEAIYAKSIADVMARPLRPSHVRPVRIRSDREYFFYIGCSLGLLEGILSGLMSPVRFSFGSEVLDVKELGYDVLHVDVERESREIAEALGRDGRKEVKVTFTSPTLLKDPLAVMRWRKKKLMLPIPEAVLATPIFMVLHDKGKLRKSIFHRLMIYVKSTFDIPYTALKTTNLVWYVYDNKALPALIGYVKYFIDDQALHRAQFVSESRYGLDFVESLSEAIVLARTYGVGDSRSAGFGHVTIDLSLSSGQPMAGKHPAVP